MSGYAEGYQALVPALYVVPSVVRERVWEASLRQVLLLEKELESATHTHEAAVREMQEQARVNQEQIEASRDHQIAHIRSETDLAVSELKAEKESVRFCFCSAFVLGTGGSVGTVTEWF